MNLKWTRFLVDVLQIIRCQFQLFNLMSTYIYTWWVILYLIIKWIHGSFHVGSTWRNGVCNLRFIVINEFKMFKATLKWIFVDLSWDNVCWWFFFSFVEPTDYSWFVIVKGYWIQNKLGSCILMVEIGVYVGCGKRYTYIVTSSI